MWPCAIMINRIGELTSFHSRSVLQTSSRARTWSSAEIMEGKEWGRDKWGGTHAAFSHPFYSSCLAPVRKTHSSAVWKYTQITTWLVGVQMPQTQLHLPDGTAETKDTITKGRVPERHNDAPHPAQVKTACRELDPQGAGKGQRSRCSRASDRDDKICKIYLTIFNCLRYESQIVFYCSYILFLLSHVPHLQNQATQDKRCCRYSYTATTEDVRSDERKAEKACTELQQGISRFL